jgi:hypothetical protein
MREERRRNEMRGDERMTRGRKIQRKEAMKKKNAQTNVP